MTILDCQKTIKIKKMQPWFWPALKQPAVSWYLLIRIQCNRCNTIIGTRLRKLNAFNFFLSTVSLIFTNMKIYVLMYLLVAFSSFTSFQFAFQFFNLQSKKRKSFNLKININFERKLYLNKLSYHTQIGRIWKSKNNSFKRDQSGYGSVIGLHFIVFQRWVNVMEIFQWFW